MSALTLKIGKAAVVNHHQEVPCHLLRDVPALGFGSVAADNLIALWAECSGGECLFAMPCGKDFAAVKTLLQP